MTEEILRLLKENYFILAYSITLFLSVLKYRFYYETRLKALPIILGYVLLTEVLGYFISEYEDILIVYEDGQHYYNHLIYNILDIVIFSYFFWIYEKSVSNDSIKILIKSGAILYLTVTLINPFFQNFILQPQLASITVGSLILTACSFTYLKQLWNLQFKFSNFNHILWWISIGIILFYPFYPIILCIGEFNEILFFELHLTSVLAGLIALMYGCISFGFLKLRKTYF